MKKTLLTASLLISSMTATFAQMPDASGWKVGDEITEQIGWGNLSFENEPMDFWQITGSGGNTTQTGGLFEWYDGKEEDLWQYVQLPAGMYKVECQGYYRCGTSWDDDPNSYGNPERWEDNALLYVQNGVYDIDSDVFTAGRTFKRPLMPRLFDYQAEQIYEDLVKEGWDMSDGNYGEKGWGPCSVPGSLAWFNAGKYQPYDDGDGTQYNTVTFFLTEDGYVRLGVKKTNPRSADSFMVTNFKMYYMGEAGEAAELMALQEEVADYYIKLAELEDKYSGGLIYTLISDVRMGFDTEYPNIEELSKEKCYEAIALLKSVCEEAEAAAAATDQLASVIEVMEILYNTTDYAGKADFAVALQAAKNLLDPDFEDWTGDETFDTFQRVYDNLCAARIAYLMTQEPVNGAYNFSSAINTPFFCDNQYTPVWNEEAQAYQFPTIEGIDESLQLENTYATVGEDGYSTVIGNNPTWIPICDNVKVYEKFQENQWIIKSTTWHGGGPVAVTIQHSYPAIGGWTDKPTGNPELLYQTITDLPNGYYSMSALMCNAGADISSLQFAYIEAGDFKETAPLTKKGNPWWGGNREAWRSGVWEKLTTNMVYVSDGKVTIGTSSDAFYASTGFQLYYYGETPDFSALLAPALAAARTAAESEELWPGDKAAAKAILEKIPATIDSQESYQTALATLAEVNAYVLNAISVVNAWKGVENFSALQETFDAESAEYDIVGTAWEYTLMLGDEDSNDTYLDAQENDKDYAAYVDYFNYRASMGELINSAEVASVIAEQNAFLIANYTRAADFAALKEALALPYNKALLASLGMAQASEENPVDVTALIVNPNFDEGQKGWNGDITYTSGEAIQEELGAAERWNCNFEVSQTIYALPAGVYQVKAQALYRDAGDAKAAFTNWIYTAFEEMDEWENPNAKLFANESETTIVSIASEFFKDKSMDAFCDKWVVAEEADENGDDVYVKHWKVQDEATAEAYQPYVEVVADGWFWDTAIDDFDENGDEATLYYPASLMGVSHRLTKNPEAYINTVTTYVEEGGSLRFGIKKDVLVANDWVVFDNFKLYYLGTEIPEGIANVAAKDVTKTIYSVSGVKQNGLQKGINIIKLSNGKVVKKFVK